MLYGKLINAYDLASDYLARVVMVCLWLPITRCPCCEGRGGEMSGYEQPEWDDCHFCYNEWFSDREMFWTFGHVHPVRLPWGYLITKTGHFTFRGWVACRVGDHVSDEQGFCRRCCRQLSWRE